MLKAFYSLYLCKFIFYVRSIRWNISSFKWSIASSQKKKKKKKDPLIKMEKICISRYDFMLPLMEKFVTRIPLKSSEDSTSRTIFEFQIHFLYFRFMELPQVLSKSLTNSHCGARMINPLKIKRPRNSNQPFRTHQNLILFFHHNLSCKSHRC